MPQISARLTIDVIAEIPAGTDPHEFLNGLTFLFIPPGVPDDQEGGSVIYDELKDFRITTCDKT